MRNPDSFDAFYASTRDRLLHETYALTGDLAAARSAVRDAYVVAWHHWRKIGARDDREAWLRPQAHSRARRRHTARLWHRDRSLPPEVQATLDALAKLSGVERQLLVLTTLSPLPLTDIARTVGLARTEAERTLQTATAQFSLHRDAPSTDVRMLLEALAEPLRDVRWPRVTIIRRNGAARRRTHTVAGAGAAVLALMASGTVVASGAGAEPTSLRDEPVTAEPSPTVPVVAEPEPVVATTVPLAADALLGRDQLTRYGGRLRWAATRTGDNLEGDGLVVPCQRERFADPQGTEALTRSWEGTTRTVVRKQVRRGGKTRVQERRVKVVRAEATELVERSADLRRAKAAYRTALAWYAGCQDPRTQLMRTRSLRGIGDGAAQFRYRTWGKQPSTITIGLARSGSLLVTTAVRAIGGQVDDDAGVTGLAAAVNGVCGTDGALTCGGRPRASVADPVRVGDPPGLLSSADLPPVEVVRGPWVGTEPVRARSNLAATRCDNTSFAGQGFTRPLTRTFVFPESPRSGQLGLSQTAGTLPSAARARQFVQGVAASIRRCGEENAGTSVSALATRSGKHQELSAWALSIEVSDTQSFPFLMAILRDGRTVSQVGFTPVGSMTMARPDFVAVAQRALERLSDLPGHRR